MTITSATSPNWEKYSLTLSGVVCQLNPPINIFPGSLGISSPLIMFPRPRGVKGENIPVGSKTELWGGDETGEMDPPKLFIVKPILANFVTTLTWSENRNADVAPVENPLTFQEYKIHEKLFYKFISATWDIPAGHHELGSPCPSHAPRMRNTSQPARS